MEPVGSTYLQAVPAPRTPDRDRGELPAATNSDSGGSKTDVARAAVPASAESTEQKGFQPQKYSDAEFKPYSRVASHEPKLAGTTEKAQNTEGSAVAAQEKPDPQIQAQIVQLKAIEEKVKAHEAAHKSAGGTMTGPVSYSYTRGPDGKNYITGGEVPISVSSGKTPQETISRMQQVIQAALAPADPSPQDRAVAAQAAALQQEARQQESTVPADSETPPAVAAEPEKQTDSSVARDSQRAYGNPAVTGTRPEASAAGKPAESGLHPTAPAFPVVAGVAPVTTAPAGSTGIATSQQMSYYA